ncbi:MAG: hypothetical protein HOQ05_06535 [Corynebacteriales bacterium]|nr:hypothetical protein [Mycobacteriales bacterium]
MAIYRHRGRGFLARLVERFAKPAPQPARFEVDLPSMGTPLPAITPQRPAPMVEQLNPELAPSWAPGGEPIENGAEVTPDADGHSAVHKQRRNSRLTTDAFHRMRTGPSETTTPEPETWTEAEQAEFARIAADAFATLPQAPAPYSYTPSLSELKMREDFASRQSLGAASGFGVQGLGSASTAAIMSQQRRADILNSLLGAANAGARMSTPPATHGPSYLRPKPSH